MATFRGERLKNARLIRAMTLTELAKRTGISKQSLSLYENTNNGRVDFEKVLSIAESLKFPTDFFFQAEKVKSKTEATYFRSQSTATKMNQTAQSKKLEYVAQIYEALLQYVVFPVLNLPKADFSNVDEEVDFDNDSSIAEKIEQIATNVRRFWEIDMDPIIDLQYLLEKNGIVITGFDTNEDKIDAFSQKTAVENVDVFLIAVALGQRSEGRILFDMAHELGHILLHPWSESLDLIPKEEFKAREKQANMFASAFLLPREGFGRELEEYELYTNDLKLYQELKNKWKVSIQAMIYRSYSLGMLTVNQYQYLMRQVSKKGWRTSEPGDEPYNLHETIFQGAIDLLIEEEILKPNEILEVFADNDLSLYQDDVEEWLNLRKGTLSTRYEEPKIVQLRNFEM
jgi:Zn-dependent peptidase ImmA (M78 family)/DNA-binding Xre family transcriptional regulator